MASGIATISVDGSDEELRRLAHWLRGEDKLRGHVKLVDQPIKHGRMGGVLEAVEVLCTGSTATALVTSLFSWLNHRRAASKVTLKVRTDNGHEVQLDCGSAEDATKVLDSVRTLLTDGVE